MAAIRVLLEEHQQADAARLRNWLKQDAEASYEVCLAANPSQTAEMISRETFDVVLLDLSVPGSSGVSRVSEARAAQPAVSIIVRGEADPESAAEILSEGAQDYLHKADLTKHGLKRSIRYAVERVRSARALRESEERYKLAIGCANDGIWDWDLRSNATWYAPRWKTILGYGEDEIGDTPKDWFSLVHPEDLHGLADSRNFETFGEDYVRIQLMGA